jgi:hypothetical protein
MVQDCDYTEAIYHVLPSRSVLRNTPNPKDIDSLVNIVNESNIEISNLKESIPYAGLAWDIAGFMGAFMVGASNIRNKMGGLLGSYMVAMVPEFLELYQNKMNGNEFLIEGGMDALFVLGSYSVGKLMGSLFNRKRRNYSSVNYSSVQNTGRPWW